MSRRARKIGILAATTLILSALPAHAVTLFNFRGTVTDVLGRPIAGLEIVDQNDRKAVTDSNGNYILPENTTGDFTLRTNDLRTYAQVQTARVDIPLDTTVNFPNMRYYIGGGLSQEAFTTATGASSVRLSLASGAPNPGLPGQSGGKSCVKVNDSRTGTTYDADFVSTDPTTKISLWTHDVEAPAGSTEGLYSLSYRILDCSTGTALSNDDPVVKQYRIDNTAPEWDPAKVTPLNFGNTVFEQQPMVAWVRESGSGIDQSRLRLAIVDLTTQLTTEFEYPAVTYDVMAEEVRSSPVVLVPARTYQATWIIRDRAGNVTEIQTTFTQTADPVFALSDAVVYGDGHATSETAATPGMTVWSFEPSIQLKNRRVDFPTGSRHAGWTTIKSQVALGSTRVKVTIAGQEQLWTGLPFDAEQTIPVYQQLVYTAHEFEAHYVRVPGTTVMLPPISMELPEDVTAARLVMEVAIESPAEVTSVCAEPDYTASGCTTDPLRFFIGERLATTMQSSTTIGECTECADLLRDPVCDERCSEKLAIFEKVPASNEPGGQWRPVTPLLSELATCDYEDVDLTSRQCLLDGVLYEADAPIVPPQLVPNYCAKYQFNCRYETEQGNLDRKYQCINSDNGRDHATTSEDPGDADRRCYQEIVVRGGEERSFFPRTNTNTELLHQFKVEWFSDWGVEDALYDELGFHFSTKRQDMRWNYALGEDVPLTSQGVPQPIGMARFHATASDAYPQNENAGVVLTNRYPVYSKCFLEHPQRSKMTQDWRESHADDYSTRAFGVATGNLQGRAGWQQWLQIGPCQADQYDPIFLRPTYAEMTAWVQPQDRYTQSGAWQDDGYLLSTWGHEYEERVGWTWDLTVQEAAEVGTACGSVPPRCNPYGVAFAIGKAIMPKPESEVKVYVQKHPDDHVFDYR